MALPVRQSSFDSWQAPCYSIGRRRSWRRPLGRPAGRAATEGIIGSYVHTGDKIGVLVEVNCETDFVARTDDFREMVKNLAMQGALSLDYRKRYLKFF